MRGTSVRDRVPVVVLYLLLVCLHVALGASMRQPHIFPDELAYLGHARYLASAGHMPDMGLTNFYQFGYSLLIVPAFVMFPDPALTYFAVIVTNAFLISALFPALHAVLRTCATAPRSILLGSAFVTCLYPAFLLQSNFAWAENALIPGYAVFIAAFARLAGRPTHLAALLFGAVGAGLYTIHTRALPLLPLAALSLCVLSGARVIRWAVTVSGLTAIVVVFTATDIAGDHLRTLGWPPGHESTTVSAFLGRAGTPARVAGTLIGAAGQVLYLAQATGGLFIVPFLWLSSVLRTRGVRGVVSEDNRRLALVIGFVLVSSLILFAESAVAMASGGDRVDHLVYGRYNEVFLPHYLAFALVLLGGAGDQGRCLRSSATVLAVTGALTVLLLGVHGDALRSRDFVAPNIFGIYPLIRALGRVDTAAISLVSIAGFVVLCQAFRRSAAAGLAVTALGFVAGAAYGNGYCTTAQASIATRDAVPSRIRAMGGVEGVSYDLALDVTQRMDLSDPAAARFFSAQYLLPRTRLDRFNSAAGDLPREGVVISTRAWTDAERLRARFVTSERGAEQALWLLPSSEHYRSAPPSYLDVSLGWRWFPGVFESGFHRRERSRGGEFRWTNGHGRLLVPVNEFPSSVSVTLRTAAPGMRVRILVNGTEVFGGPYVGGSRTFSLAGTPVTEWVEIELVSEVIVPAERAPGSPDRRRLGVAVREVRLNGSASPG